MRPQTKKKQNSSSNNNNTKTKKRKNKTNKQRCTFTLGAHILPTTHRLT